MRIEERGIIFEATGRTGPERAASFTSLCTTSAGSILSAFQIGSSKNAPDSTLRLCRSKDKGRTWRELDFRFETMINGIPGSLSCGEIVEPEPGRLLLIATWFERTVPGRALFDPITQGILPSRQLMAVSTNDGDCWGPWKELTTAPLRGCSSTGPILRWADGTIAYPFESFKEAADQVPPNQGAWFLVSTDGGRTFGEPLLIARHPQQKVYYWDQRLCAGKAPGEFFGLFWTHDLEQKKDLNVHARRGSILFDNAGKGQIAATSIPGQIAAPLLLGDEQVLAFVVHRGTPGTLTLWSSSDGGASWPDQLGIYVHDERAALSQKTENIDFGQYWEDMGKWSFGHPAIRSLGDGKVLLAYYAGAPNRTSIHWVRIALGS